MAQFKGKKVLILERHFKFGGFTHVFKRKRNKFLWDVGIHYIGDLAEGSVLKRIFDIITKGKLKWQKMPSLFEKFVYPDFTFDVYDDPEKYKGDIIKQFPEEEEAVLRYFDDVKKVNTWWGRHITMKGKPAFTDQKKQEVKLGKFNSPNITVDEYLKENFKSEKLRAVVASQWGDYGLPPKQASFMIHCCVVQHYLKGGYYPVGGSGLIGEYTQEVIEETGGIVFLNHVVD
jgi:phytoene dehydrogenase-like protein